jgi:hypothetical protein
MIAWVPVDVVARSLIAMARADAPVFNVIAPRPIPWSTVFGAFARALNVPLVDYDAWVERVAAAAEANRDAENVPAFALVDFFRAAKFGERKTCVERAVEVAEALREMEPLAEEDALRYVQFWRKIGHLKA